MSEHKIGDFIRQNKRSEMLAAAGVLITAVVAVGINSHKRHNRQMGVVDSKNLIPEHELSLAERSELFRYETDSDEEPDFTTKIAAFLYLTSVSAAEKATSEAVIGAHLGVEVDALREPLQQLKDYHFIEPAVLQSNSEAEAWAAMADLKDVEAKGLSMPLLRAISEQPELR